MSAPRWDGAAWQPLGSGVGDVTEGVNALAVTPDGTLPVAVALVQGMDGGEVAVYDAIGRRVSAHAVGADGRVPLPAGLAPGVYVVRLTLGPTVHSVRWVVPR